MLDKYFSQCETNTLTLLHVISKKKKMSKLSLVGRVVEKSHKLHPRLEKMIYLYSHFTTESAIALHNLHNPRFEEEKMLLVKIQHFRTEYMYHYCNKPRFENNIALHYNLYSQHSRVLPNKRPGWGRH